MSAVCQLHQRAAEQTCKRCGAFVCDWCVKLSPDWGSGLCFDCTRLTAPKPSVVRTSFGGGFLVAFLAINGVGAFVSFIVTLAEGNARLNVLVGSAVWAVVGIGGAMVIVRNARR